MAHLTTVIPVYNGGALLEATLQSLAAQTRRPDRVVVLDDASTDDTVARVKSFKGIACDCVSHPRNFGLFPNHNRGLKLAAESDYLHLLHANDTVGPRFYERMLAPLEAENGLAASFCQYGFIDEAGQPVNARPPGPNLPAYRTTLHRFLVGQLELKSRMIHAVVIKSQRRPLPCQFRLDLPILGDVMFHSELARQCKALWEVPEILCYYRLLKKSATRTRMTHLQAWVLDEWRAMQWIRPWLNEGPARSWLRQQKLKGLFAARAHVKAQMTRRSSPDFAQQIRATAIETTGPLYWCLGGAVVWARDLVFYRLLKHKPSPLNHE